MNIVFPDADSIGKDVDLRAFEEYGNLQTYGYLTEEEMAEKVVDADVLIVNKLPVNERTIGRAEHLKLVCVTATGTNNLDKEYLERRDIAWRNVAGYSTDVVSQHTFALLFYIYEKLRYYDDYVKSGTYANDRMFTHFGQTFHELAGKTWGIIGLGTIGKKVASIASAFGCRVICYSASGGTYKTEYEQVGWARLLAESDIISIHAPLSAATEGLMNAEAFSKMKSTAVLINVARGPIVVEQDLADALEKGEIAGAGLDVLSEEPANPDNPLLKIMDSNKLVITPHIAWASVEARNRVMQIIHGQIGEFFGGCSF